MQFSRLNKDYLVVVVVVFFTLAFRLTANCNSNHRWKKNEKTSSRLYN